MNTWFEVTARYIKMDENGHDRKAAETYLLDAINFTEAESRIFKELKSLISGEFIVTKIVKTRVSEIIPSDNGDRWYKAKVAFICVNEESGKEQKVSQLIMVFSNDIPEAYKNVIAAMQGMMADFEIQDIVESNIVDVFPYLTEETALAPHLKPITTFLAAE
jgi:hypothetical protein